MTDIVRKQLEEYHDDAFFWALRCSNQDAEVAKNALQMVYLKILEGRAKFKGLSSYKTWLFSIVSNTVIDLMRKRNLRVIKEESYANLLNLDSVDEVGKESLDLESIKARIKELSERQQEVLQLHFYHNMTLEEIATIMNVSIGTVRQHYDRAKKNMKILLTNKND